MKLENFKIAGQLGLGFGAIIVITLILGSIATFNMFTASKMSAEMAEKYVPASDIANEIERNSQKTMYSMRGYAYTQERDFYNEGMLQLEEVKGFLAEATRLANTQNLDFLKEQVSTATEYINEYESLAKQTNQLNNQLQSLVEQMNQSAGIFTQNCTDFISEQHELMVSEINSGAQRSSLMEREAKIRLGNNIIDQGNELRVSNFRAQSLRNPANLENAIRNFNIATQLEDIREITYRDVDLERIDLIEKSANDYAQAINEYLDVWNEVEAINVLRNDTGNNVLASAQETAAYEMAIIDESSNNIDNSLASSSIIVVTGLIIAVIIALIFAVIITRSITSGLTRGVGFAKVIADGDLSTNIESKYLTRGDEIGDLGKALQRMMEKLRSVIGDIISGADNISGASTEMSSSSQQMSQGATEQASSAEEVSSSMEEMVSNIQQNTDNAQQTETIAQNVSSGIQKVGDSANESLASIRNIADKINIINDIAFQTNILALNAAVEAARAGEHGRGFAVVAAEVRKLAERSKIAADEIVTLATQSVSLTEGSGKLMNDLIPDVEKTARLVQEITAASLEQNSGADQINNAIQQLNQVIQQNAAVSEEMATSSEELSGQAEQLKETVSYFTLDLDRNYKKSTLPKPGHITQTTTPVKQVPKATKVEKNGADLKMFNESVTDNNYESY